MAKRALIAAVISGVLVLAMYLGAWPPRARPLSTNLIADVPPVEQPAGTAITTSQPIATIPLRESGDKAPALSLEERSAAIKRRISDTVGTQHREEYVETLVGEGLSRSDSANIVQTFLDDLAECHFAATRGRYEAYGLTYEQFVSGAEKVWKSRDYHSVSIETIARYAPECAAQAAQQAGIPIAVELNGGAAASAPEDFGVLAQPNLVAEPRRAEADDLSLGWAPQMQAKIRAHIDRYPGVSLTDLRIKCEERGCVVLIQGQKIPIFDFEFDRFAEENGFASALVGGDAARRIIWLRK